MTLQLIGVNELLGALVARKLLLRPMRVGHVVTHVADVTEDLELTYTNFFKKVRKRLWRDCTFPQC